MLSGSDGAFDDVMTGLAGGFLSKDTDFDKQFHDWLEPISDPTYTGPPPVPTIYRDNYSTRAWLMNKNTPTL